MALGKKKSYLVVLIFLWLEKAQKNTLVIGPLRLAKKEHIFFPRKKIKKGL